MKSLLARHEIDVSGVERRPGSAAQREALHESLSDVAGGVDDKLLAAAQQVTDAVAAHDAQVAPAVGVDLHDVQAAFLKIGSVTSTGTGVRLDSGRFSGGISIDDVRAGGGGDPTAR